MSKRCMQMMTLPVWFLVIGRPWDSCYRPTRRHHILQLGRPTKSRMENSSRLALRNPRNVLEKCLLIWLSQIFHVSRIHLNQMYSWSNSRMKIINFRPSCSILGKDCLLNLFYLIERSLIFHQRQESKQPRQEYFHVGPNFQAKEWMGRYIYRPVHPLHVYNCTYYLYLIECSKVVLYFILANIEFCSDKNAILF